MRCSTRSFPPSGRERRRQERDQQVQVHTETRAAAHPDCADSGTHTEEPARDPALTGHARATSGPVRWRCALGTSRATTPNYGCGPAWRDQGASAASMSSGRGWRNPRSQKSPASDRTVGGKVVRLRCQPVINSHAIRVGQTGVDGPGGNISCARMVVRCRVAAGTLALRRAAIVTMQHAVASPAVGSRCWSHRTWVHSRIG
jgi:hypothetical protein